MPSGPRSRRAMVALLCTAQFIVVLDATIVPIALPAMQRSLHMATADLQWVLSAYTLAFAGFLVLAGRLADLHGRRRVFMAGMVLFTVASLACGLSRSGPVLIAARTVQGLGAGAVAPAALAAIAAAIPDGPARRRALGVWTAAAAGGGAAGWMLGGVLTEQAGCVGLPRQRPGGRGGGRPRAAARARDDGRRPGAAARRRGRPGDHRRPRAARLRAPPPGGRGRGR